MEKKIDQINERLLKFTGTLCLPESIEIDEDVTFGVTANIIKREQRSNQDNTFNLVHTAKLIGEAIIQTKHGKNVVCKAKGSPSQRLRSKMRIEYQGDDFDAYYEIMVNKLIINWELVEEFLRDK